MATAGGFPARRSGHQLSHQQQQQQAVRGSPHAELSSSAAVVRLSPVVDARTIASSVGTLGSGVFAKGSSIDIRSKGMLSSAEHGTGTSTASALSTSRRAEPQQPFYSTFDLYASQGVLPLSAASREPSLQFDGSFSVSLGELDQSVASIAQPSVERQPSTASSLAVVHSDILPQ